MNGEPLPLRHGYPVRILTPGLFGEKSVKWVTRIELVDHDVKGFYEQQGWGPNFVIPIRTTFFAGDFATPFARGGRIPIRGNAFAGNRGVGGVEVSADGGQTWQTARIDYQDSQYRDTASWGISRPVEPARVAAGRCEIRSTALRVLHI
jgi:DMSO/TMAO reductase YedYZ molybdopterin-dependent catalytic subunit